MGEIFYFPWEVRFLEFLQHIGEGTALQTVLEALNQAFSACGEEIVGILVLGFLYWGIDKEKGKRIGLIVMMAFTANCMIKNVFHRLRPYQSVDSVKLLRPVDGYSFPSGHSANAASIYPSVAYEFREKKYRWLTAVAIVLPILIALSRNYLGAHWPTDVIVGLLQGLACMVLVEYACAKVPSFSFLCTLCMLLACLGVFYCRTEDYFTSLGMMFGFRIAIWFEERYVGFRNTSLWHIAVLRTVGGGILFLLLNSVLKAFLGIVPIHAAAWQYGARTLRYGIVTFIMLGVYPMAFDRMRKHGSESIQN